jgi:very-short-patch-repair endonuclease
VQWWERARRQSGVIARDQLRDAGVSEDSVRGLVARHELVELLPAVYSPRPVPDSRRQRMWAVALWSGGVISHQSAAELWKLPVRRDLAVHVTVADRRFRQPVPDTRLHRVPLARLHHVPYDGLPITARDKTIIELLRTLPHTAARGLLDRALQQHWVTEFDLSEAVRKERCRTGNVQIRTLLAEIEPGAHAESERLLHRILSRAGLGGWVAQYEITLPGGRAYADVAFPEQQIVIEVDGRRHHDTGSDQFESDRVRQNQLIALGWRVLRFTWARLTQDPAGVLAEIVQLLAA